MEGEEQPAEGGKKQYHKQEQDENSFYFKYYYGPRPKYTRVAVTKDTEIPAILPKDQRKKRPDQVAFDKVLQQLDLQSEELRNKMVFLIK